MKISKRHLVKSLSWRLIGTLDTFIFTWIITGNIEEGINVSGITTVTKIIWYYIHERIWFNSRIAVSKRHIIKTFSWRGIGTLDTIFFSWVLIGNPFLALKIGFFETVSKMLLYYGHEKLWFRISFGLEKRNKLKNLNF